MIDKKTAKKLRHWQLDIVDQIEAFEYIVDHYKKEPQYLNPVKRVLEERKKHLEIMKGVTGIDVEPDQSDLKYSKRILKFFSDRRLFSCWAGVLSENARMHTEMTAEFPQLKRVVEAEKRLSDSLKRTELVAKKQRDLNRKINSN